MDVKSRVRIVLFLAAAMVATSLAWVTAQQRGGRSAVAIDPDDIGGVVTSSRGP